LPRRGIDRDNLRARFRAIDVTLDGAEFGLCIGGLSDT
jgi:hypothetical protein